MDEFSQSRKQRTDEGNYGNVEASKERKKTRNKGLNAVAIFSTKINE